MRCPDCLSSECSGIACPASCTRCDRDLRVFDGTRLTGFFVCRCPPPLVGGPDAIEAAAARAFEAYHVLPLRFADAWQAVQEHWRRIARAVLEQP